MGIITDCRRRAQTGEPGRAHWPGAVRLAALALALLSAWAVVHAQTGPQPTGDGPPQAGAAVYLARRGWHVDVGFAVASLTAPLDAVAREFPGARYLFFGFGDRRYLMAKHRNMPALLAALWPGKGLILATALGATPADAFGAAQVIEIRISPAQLLAAQDFIWRSLGDRDLPSTDALPVAAPGPYEGSLYLSARPGYSAFHTCNTWAAEALGRAGLPVHSAGVLFAGQLWRQARKAAAEKSQPPRAPR
ncbi:MAG: DUF2459 domain-containing protein [Steroidobacteraceae bacterium]|jgi:hypothetical protein